MPKSPPNKVLHHLRRRISRFPANTETETPEHRGSRRIRMALTAAAMLFSLFIIYPIIERAMQEGGNVARVTPCDNLAAHPFDVEKLAPGISDAGMNVSAARSACLKAHERHPGDGRILYQLSRTYGKAGDEALELTHLRKSADAGYAQGQFMLATRLIHNEDESRHCEGGRWLVKAARQRHFYAKVFLVNGWMDNIYAACGLDMSDTEIAQLVSAAGELAITADEKNDLATLESRRAKR